MPSQAFHDAANYLSSSSASTNVPTNVKLELYGLFKYLTAAHSPNIARPGLLDFAGRAKWDVWLDAAKKYEEREAEAEVRYLDIARGLGWVEGVQPELAVATRTMTTNTMSPPHQLVGLDSDDGEDEGVGGGGGEDGIWDPPDYQEENAGVGTIISSVAQSKVEVTDEQPLHSLSVQGDADALREYLAEHPNTDVNNPDEFGYTALHLACDRGHVDVVKVLLERNADRSVKDPDELTALELAEEAGKTDIATLLKA